MRKLQLVFTAAAALLSSAAAQEAPETTSVASSVSTREASEATSITSPILTRSATTTTTSSSPTGTATHTVSVGLDHKYIPDTIEAEVGDIINFKFYGANHSVVKAEFGQPCVPYDMIHPGEESFFSGAIEQPDGNLSPLPTWTLRVNTTEPVFFYCSAPESCITWKMIGVINPNRTRTRDEQVEFVTNGTTTFQLSPGEPIPAEGGPPPGGDSDDDAASPPPPADNSSEGGGGLAPGAIAGIAVGGAAVLIIGVALVYVCGRKGGIEKGYRRSRVSPSAAVAAPPSMIEAHYHDEHSRSHSPYFGVGGGLPPKSPPPPSTHTSSIYGGMPNSGTYAPDPYRSRSPNQLSDMGSPHTSYLGGHSSPGFAPPGFGSPRLNQEPMTPPLAELEAHSEPRQELG
ncbi:hypothetical protein DL766_005504 [Monosporascus sp. MC13-8B]|uniref:Extracellular serine-rich protein n=1 Tax=Monosporascus cannonballus TaxID=155416 RepID=A0ABY0HD80_9PEZI|nr:hypothetical protein DL763_010360 [Monosporascus cannonballus]RYO87770.1 hypothetical protein DL762_004060 [Monosporascus cannonballus]RYP29217.1 hypothetical protein DL766_005504 [Monosporascus sp. MC13-8B]